MAVLTLGCNQKTADQANRFKTMAADCKKDDDCAKGFICTEKKCTKGKRTKAELAARAKAKAEAKQKALAAKRAVKPAKVECGENLSVSRIRLRPLDRSLRFTKQPKEALHSPCPCNT